MINLTNLNLKYRSLNNPTLKDINLNIQQGEKVLIVGPSGSGKSTLGKLLNGLIPNSQRASVSGDNSVYGLKLGASSTYELSTKIGTIMQDQDSQFVGLTVAEDIAFYLENLAIAPPEIHQKVDDVMKLLGIEDISDTDPSRLSGGQKQKVSLAGVLVNDVDCLLLDEPLANLDPQSAVDVMELINDINHNLNKTIVMIEHRLEDALQIPFDKLIVIDNGEIISCDSPSQVLKTDVLASVGIRMPLFIEALSKLKYDFQTVPNMLEFSHYDMSKIVLNGGLNCKKAKELSNPVLEIDSLSFAYNDHPILNDITIRVKKGEIVSLLGANGAGKSTLCAAIVGINNNYTGNIKINNEQIDNLGICKRSHLIGYVMQNPNHYITETIVEDEVAFSLRRGPENAADVEGKVVSALEACRLTKYRKWPINMLSYGQRRRVTIAACLVKEPQLIILDEPTAGQDFETFKSIMDTVQELRDTMSISVLVITHNMQLAYEYSDRAIVLGDGKVQYSGDITKLYEQTDILKNNNLRSTSIQRFSDFHQISANALGSLLIGGDV